MMALSICGVHSMDVLGKCVEICFEGFGYAIWHGNVDILLVVITVNGQSTVVLPFKLHGDVVIF